MAGPVRTFGAFLHATVTAICGHFSQVNSWKRWHAIYPKDACQAAWKVERGHEATMGSLFPMFVKLTGKQCLVVGAGKVGEPKIGGLIDTGASIHVVAIEAGNRVREWADEGKITLELRAFSAAALDGKFLAIAATASSSLNEIIYREAQRRGVLCNVVDVP